MHKEHPQNVHWTHEQQSAKRWKGQTDWEYAHVKQDGWRVTFFRQQSRVTPIAAYGKDRTKTGARRGDLEFLTRFPRLRDDPFVLSLAQRLKPFSSIDCEIVTLDSVRSNVTTALRDENMPIRILPFAIPHFDGGDMRHMPLEWASAQCNRLDLPFIEFKIRSEFPTKVDRDDLLNVANANSEGWVLKRTQYYGWYKVKREPTVDCFVTGTIPGEGKYAGLIGALVVSVWKDGKAHEIASVSGMTDEVRQGLSAYPISALKGLVVEVKYQMIGAGGRLVHPRYSRIRFDKPKSLCTIDQLEDGE